MNCIENNSLNMFDPTMNDPNNPSDMDSINTTLGVMLGATVVVTAVATGIYMRIKNKLKRNNEKLRETPEEYQEIEKKERSIEENTKLKEYQEKVTAEEKRKNEKMIRIKNIILSRDAREKAQKTEIELKIDTLNKVQELTSNPLQKEVEKLFDQVKKLDNEIENKRNSIKILKREREKEKIVTGGKIERRRFETYQKPQKLPINRRIKDLDSIDIEDERVWMGLNSETVEQLERTADSEIDNSLMTKRVIGDLDRKIKNVLRQSDRFTIEDIDLLKELKDKIKNGLKNDEFKESDKLEKEIDELIRNIEEADRKNKRIKQSMKNKMIESWIENTKMATPTDKISEEVPANSTAAGIITEQKELEISTNLNSLIRPIKSNLPSSIENGLSRKEKLSKLDDLSASSAPSGLNELGEQNDSGFFSISRIVTYLSELTGISKRPEPSDIFNLSNSDEAIINSLTLSGELSAGSSMSSLNVEENTRDRNLSEKDMERLKEKKEELEKRIKERKEEIERLNEARRILLKYPKQQENKRLNQKKINRRLEE